MKPQANSLFHPVCQRFINLPVLLNLPASQDLAALPNLPASQDLAALPNLPASQDLAALDLTRPGSIGSDLAALVDIANYSYF